MRRQLALAKRLVPLLVRQQLRQEAAAATLGRSSGRVAGESSTGLPAQRLDEACREATAVATTALDELCAEVDAHVGHVFAEFGAVESISLAAWSDSFRQAGEATTSDDSPTHGMVTANGMLAMNGSFGLLSSLITPSGPTVAPECPTAEQPDEEPAAPWGARGG